MTLPRIITQGESHADDSDGRVITEMRRAKGFANEAQVRADPSMPRAVFGSDPLNPSRICTAMSVHYVDESIDAWDITLEFVDLGFTPSSSGSEAGSGTLVRIERFIRPLRVWRVDGAATSGLLRLAWPSDKSEPDPEVDIGGWSVDVGGEPIDFLIHSHRLTISASAREPLPEILWDRLAGTRNDQPWRGYPKGKALYVGTNSQPNGKRSSTVEHTIEIDAWWHLRQVASSIPGGGVQRFGGNLALLINGQRAGCAAHVYWYQPFPIVANFGLLSP